MPRPGTSQGLDPPSDELLLGHDGTICRSREGTPDVILIPDLRQERCGHPTSASRYGHHVPLNAVVGRLEIITGHEDDPWTTRSRSTVDGLRGHVADTFSSLS